MSSILCLMGPTASGKTQLAVELVKRHPFEIISVDSAMVYRGMDIGTAKPDADILRIAPHRLINILDPAEIYSAGRFREEALREIKHIIAAGKIPLLVGGTMLYFRALMHGIAAMPRANAAIRAALAARASKEGWESLHAQLAETDPDAARRIHPHDSQRIQRALEVFQLTGKPISVLQRESTRPLAGYQVRMLALAPSSRELLHERIAQRFDVMLRQGLIEEVRGLYARGDLSRAMPSIRTVGYQQVWDYLEGLCDEKTMRDRAIAATRQFAKRQLTWLRSWPDLEWIDSESPSFSLGMIKND